MRSVRGTSAENETRVLLTGEVVHSNVAGRTREPIGHVRYPPGADSVLAGFVWTLGMSF
jgi:hypothetical protein